MRPFRGRDPGSTGSPDHPANRAGRVLSVVLELFGTEIADRRALWGFVLRVSILVTVAAEILNLLSVALFPGAWGFERFAIQTFVIAFSTAIPSTWFVGWTAMQLTRAKQDLHRLSRSDGLTGLPNRLSFQEMLESGRHDVLAIVDIDHFKRINDTFGHPVGDEVIREIGRRLAALHPGAFVSRIGGEEFACLAGDGHMALLNAQLERIRFDLAGRPLHVGPNAIRVTISIGLAERAGRSMHAFYCAADGALYAAKNLGRNLILREGEVPPVTEVATYGERTEHDPLKNSA